MVAEIWALVISSFVDQLVALKVSLFALTNRAYSVNNMFHSIIQLCYVQYQSNNVSDS